VLAKQRLLNIGRVLEVWEFLHSDPVVDLDMNEQDGPQNDNDYSTDIQAGDQQVEQGICTSSPCEILESVPLRVKLRAFESDGVSGGWVSCRHTYRGNHRRP
jgi:hypothetical protein